MTQITVRKLDLAGALTRQYVGNLVRRDPEAVVLEAYFDLADMRILDVVLKQGDRFVETYYAARWYNVFEISDRDDGKLKGWYCNLSRPAVLDETTVSWVDLALDLWVWPDCRQAMLDEDEFEALTLVPAERERALAAFDELRRSFEKKRPPR